MGGLSRHDSLVSRLLEWGATSLRDLPWRKTSDPWAVLVSEVMLQQTSVARVLPKYEAFLEAYPTPSALACAPLGEALLLWQGLGYPRRCKNLRAAATVIANDHHGTMPATLDELLALPGVGAYTARAVLAFAHRADAAVVDVNVSRVLSRVEGRCMKARELQEFADSLVPTGLAWEWNQVMMDFGARQCTVRSPNCSECPVARVCRWRGEGDDPAPGSAGASRPQARFEGSNRQVRGRILRAAAGGQPIERLVEIVDNTNDGARVRSLLADLVAEGLLVEDAGVVSLP